VLVSTPSLATALDGLSSDIFVMPNALDERIWQAAPQIRQSNPATLRMLVMGSQTHDGDLAVIADALAAMRAQFGQKIAIDVIGMTSAMLPRHLNSLVVPANFGTSYPAFVGWLCQQPQWHVGLVPLADTRFNTSKSAIKTLDYAALGLAVLASDVPAYQDSLAARGGGLLVPNQKTAWIKAITALLQDPRRRHAMATKGRALWAAEATLAAQAGKRAALWHALSPRPIKDQKPQPATRKPAIINT
jgi:hypothetical protein